jgi:hypothetical protein
MRVLAPVPLGELMSLAGYGPRMELVRDAGHGMGEVLRFTGPACRINPRRTIQRGYGEAGIVGQRPEPRSGRRGNGFQCRILFERQASLFWFRQC